MLKNFLRKLLKPIIQECMNGNEASISNRYIADMRSIHKNLNDIRIALNGIEDRELAALCIKKAADISNEHERLDKALHEVQIRDAQLSAMGIKPWGIKGDVEIKKGSTI